jgi:RNA polymerase sigma-70 factor (ECF subfamily)
MAGDRQAFDVLVRKHYPNIYAYCYRRMKDENTAADLTQDVFLKVVATIYKYRFTGKFTNFLFTIAVNACNDYLRRSKPLTDCDIETLPAMDRHPLDTIIRDEEAEQLQNLLYSLPDMQREALILYYYHDMKAKDIAEITGVPVATAKSRIKQGLDKLKKAYGKDEEREK